MAIPAAACIALLALGVPPAPAPGGAWLDATPVAQWNVPGGKVPRAPPAEPLDPRLRKQCSPLFRPPGSAADRAVAAAGWTLVGAAQRFGETEVVTAQASVDGMCRPWGFQVFVFSGGRLAGTISPRPMDARTDGAAQVPVLSSAAELLVPFSRYAPADPMCCPSRISTAQFRIERREKGPVLVAGEVSTAPAP